jgi:hypothetical protein
VLFEDEVVRHAPTYSEHLIVGADKLIELKGSKGADV